MSRSTLRAGRAALQFHSSSFTGGAKGRWQFPQPHKGLRCKFKSSNSSAQALTLLATVHKGLESYSSRSVIVRNNRHSGCQTRPNMPSHDDAVAARTHTLQEVTGAAGRVPLLSLTPNLAWEGGVEKRGGGQQLPLQLLMKSQHAQRLNTNSLEGSPGETPPWKVEVPKPSGKKVTRREGKARGGGVSENIPDVTPQVHYLQYSWTVLPT